MKHNLTEQQKAIIAHPLKSGEVMLINAGAGAGKSSTLHEIAAQNPDKKFLYLVFNRDAKLQADSVSPENMTCRTVHSLCFDPRYSGQLYPYTGSRINAYLKSKGRKYTRKYVSVIRALMNSFIMSEFTAIDERTVTYEWAELFATGDAMIRAKQAEMIALVKELVNLSFNTKIKNVPMPFDGLIKSAQMRCMKDGHTLSLFKGYDVVLVDEAQDQNPAFSAILVQCMQTGGPAVVLVGDPRQSLYTWRGSVNTIENFAEQIEAGELKGKIFGLSTSFRFGHDIADLANQVLSYGNISPQFPVQGVDEPKQLKGTAYLARTNSRLFGKIADILTSNPAARIHLAGTNEKEGWSPREKYNFKIIEDLHYMKADYDQNGGGYKTNFDINGAQRWMKNPLLSPFGSWARLSASMAALKRGDEEIDLPEEIITDTMTDEEKKRTAEINESGVDAADVREVQSFYNFYCMFGVSILRTMEEASTGPDKADFCFSTAHKSKGLEWEKVIIMGDFIMIKDPRVLVKSEKSIEQSEVDLFYVAVTRGQVVTLEDDRPLSLYDLEEYGRILATEKWLNENN